MEWKDIPLIFDMTVLCKITGLSYETLRKECVEGHIPCVKLGTQWRFDRETIRDFLAGRTIREGRR